MGWKGTLRSITAAVRAAEREAQRQHKQALREEMVAEAAAAVADWEDYTKDIISIHTNLADAIDWHAIADTPRPVRPELENRHHKRAQSALVNFEPSIFDMFRGGSEKRRKKLETNLNGAALRDAADFEAASQNYNAALEEWEQESGLARRLIDGEAFAIKEVVEELQSLSKEDLIGSTIEFSISDNFIHAQPKVHSDSIVPGFRRKQLASGKLSETKMPAGQFNELYQDYVSSVALKVAGDLFQILPLEEVYVTCMSMMLNTQTGHQELSPILSVQFVRNTMEQIDLTAVDPSDSMRNFRHVMDFKKSRGFAPIEALKPVE